MYKSPWNNRSSDISFILELGEINFRINLPSSPLVKIWPLLSNRRCFFNELKVKLVQVDVVFEMNWNKRLSTWSRFQISQTYKARQNGVNRTYSNITNRRKGFLWQYGARKHSGTKTIVCKNVNRTNIVCQDVELKKTIVCEEVKLHDDISPERCETT